MLALLIRLLIDLLAWRWSCGPWEAERVHARMHTIRNARCTQLKIVGNPSTVTLWRGLGCCLVSHLSFYIWQLQAVFLSYFQNNIHASRKLVAGGRAARAARPKAALQPAWVEGPPRAPNFFLKQGCLQGK